MSITNIDTTHTLTADEVYEEAFFANIVPETSGSTGVKNHIIVDENYLYYCYDTNSWAKIASLTGVTF